MSKLHYLKRIPKKENPPLLVLLHGYGSNEHDLFSFSNELSGELLIISVQAPFTISFGSYAWYSIDFDSVSGKFSDVKQARESIEKIALFIDEVQNKYSTNKKKTFILGFSQGATLSYSLSFFYPNLVQHVIALSGYINKDLLPKNFPNKITTDYYCSHGIADQVLPIDWARKSKKLLETYNFKHKYEEYQTGHNLSQQNFFSFKKWIEERL